MVKIFIFAFISVFIAGCANSYQYQNHASANSSSTLSKMTAQKKSLKNSKFRLLVMSKPKNAKVRIINIKPRYKDNMVLKKGKYLVEVSKNGFDTYKKWINLTEDKALHVEMKKRELPLVGYSGVIEWRGGKIADKFKKYSICALMDSLRLSVADRIWLDDKISKKRYIKWKTADDYCKNLKLYSLQWRLPSCYEAKRYSIDVKKYLNYQIDDGLWTVRKNYLSNYRGKKCEEYKNNDLYYAHFTCVAKENPKKLNYSVQKIASLILKDFKGISKANAYQKALNIKYSNPKIVDTRYDTKKQILSFDLVSSRLKGLKIEEFKNRFKNALTAKNSAEIRKNVKVYNFDNSTLISISVKTYRTYIKAFDFKKIKGFQALRYKNYTFDNSMTYASLPIKLNTNRGRMYILIDRVTSGKYKLNDFLKMHGQSYDVGRAELYIDPNVSSDVKEIRRYYYKKRVEIKVSPKYAKDMINLINAYNFKPTVLFDVKNDKFSFKGIKEFSKSDTFVEKGEFEKAYYDVKKLREFIQKYPNSNYVSRAQNRIQEIKNLYKGYEPTEIFKVEGCVGYFPLEMVSKRAKKLHIKPSVIDSSYFKKTTWSGLCRRGLLSGRGYMRMVSKDGNFIVGIEGKMRDGFFIGKIKGEIKKITKRLSSSSYRYLSQDINENISLKNKKEFLEYQRRVK